jgi:hypothetical protein
MWLQPSLAIDLQRNIDLEKNGFLFNFKGDGSEKKTPYAIIAAVRLKLREKFSLVNLKRT